MLARSLLQPHKHLGNAAFFVGVGLLVWFVATIVLRMFGQVFFRPDSALVLLIHFVVVGPVLVGLLFWLFEHRRLTPDARPVAALQVALPGMFLDVLCLAWYPTLFPNLPLSARNELGGWLLWGYAWVILAGLYGRPSRTELVNRWVCTTIGVGVGIGGTIFYRFVGQHFFLDTPRCWPSTTP